MRFKLRRYYLYYLARVASFIFYALPLRIGLTAGAILGRLVFSVLSEYRNIAIENLKAAFGGEKTKDEIRRIARRAFENLSKNAVELINFPKINKANLDRIIRVKNIDIIDSALEKGKGALLITGHFGNWELLGATLRLKGYPGAAVGRRIYFERYDRYLNALRKVHDVNVIYRDESPKKILRVLKDNGIVGILADQDMDSVDGVFVNFFGRPAYTPTGPVLLAKASGASIIPAFVIREGSRHTMIIEQPIELIDTGNKEADLATNTQRWSDLLESYIRKYPDHWVWMHRRWKTQEKRVK